MKKSDLKSGMLIQTTDDRWNMLIDDIMYDLYSGGHLSLKPYNEDLSYIGVLPESFAIKKVIQIDDLTVILLYAFRYDHIDLADMQSLGLEVNILYENKKYLPKEMTLEEVEEALGYKIKIVE